MHFSERTWRAPLSGDDSFPSTAKRSSFREFAAIETRDMKYVKTRSLVDEFNNLVRRNNECGFRFELENDLSSSNFVSEETRKFFLGSGVVGFIIFWLVLLRVDIVAS